MGLTAYIARLKAVGLASISSLSEASNRDVFASPSAPSLSSLHLSSPNLAATYLTSLYPKLKLHYNWFRSTQRGQIREYGRRSRSSVEGYRWRGRTADHVLTSGLDDYPRAIPPHLGELHVDLASWMAFFARTMKEVAVFLEMEEDIEEFEDHYEDIVHNIDGTYSYDSPIGLNAHRHLASPDLHWNEQKEMYCDVSVDSEGSLHLSASTRARYPLIQYLSCRRIVSRLSRRIHLSLPATPFPARTIFTSSRSRPRSSPRP